ncbi:MAG: TM2 domain-containing protein [Candidatus Coproplasma sp.]
MTQDKVNVAFNNFAKDIPLDYHNAFRAGLKNMDDNYMPGLMSCPIKIKGLELFFSIFFGGLGVDRFYLGDVGLGIGKLAVNAASIFCRLSPWLGLKIVALVLSLVSFAWYIADIFVCYKRVKELNYKKLGAYVDEHRVRIVPPTPTIREAIRKVTNEQPVQDEPDESDESDVPDQISVHQFEDSLNEQELQEQVKPQVQPIKDEQPQIDTIYHCKTCGQAIRIRQKAAKYRCPKCRTVFGFNDIASN